MKTLFLALLAAAVAAPAAEPLPQVRDARKHLEQKQPAQATAVLQQIAARQPNDPYIAYDLGVAAYAAGKYDEADRIWQELAGRQLPDKLRDNVWQQVGNVSFRRGELAEKVKIEDALPLWEQSREAYRIVLAARPKDEATQHNLKIVERKLAQLHSQLAKRLLKEAEKQSLEKTIEKLQAAVDHQRTARNLEPENQQYQQELKETEKKLADNYTTKAQEEEKKADATLKKPTTNRWERERAEDNLQTALTDYREAKALTPENQTAAEGEKRVLEKLSKLLTQSGKELQKEAQQQEQHSPDNAESRYEQALEKFEEALKIDEKNEPAKQGEQEVRQALEKLHMREGDKQAEAGRKDAPNQPAKAAEEMMDAVRHYEQAQVANPLNTEAQPKIDALQKELPPMLNALAKREQQRAAEAEAKSLEKAVAHLEKASTSFEMAQQIDENNLEANQGSKQVQEDLMRLREQIAKKAAEQQQAQQAKPQKQDENLSFSTMLSQWKSEDKQREYEESRRAPTTKYDPDSKRIFKNW